MGYLHSIHHGLRLHVIPVLSLSVECIVGSDKASGTILPIVPSMQFALRRLHGNVIKSKTRIIICLAYGEICPLYSTESYAASASFQDIAASFSFPHQKNARWSFLQAIPGIPAFTIDRICRLADRGSAHIA